MPVAKYWIEVVNNNEIYKIKLQMKNGEVKERLCIEQIDYMTSTMKNKEEFLTSLLKAGFLQTNATDIYIAYNASKAKQKTDLIFNNKLINSCAKDSYNKKLANVPNPSLDKTDLLNSYIKQLKFYMLNSSSLNSIKRSRIFPFHLKYLILDYMELDSKPDKSPVVYADMSEIMSNIEKEMQNYVVLRNVVLWEKKYLNNLEKVKEKNSNIDNQIKLADYINEKLLEEEQKMQRKKDLEDAKKFLEHISQENDEYLQRFSEEDNKKHDEIHSGLYIKDPLLKQYILENFSIEEINTDINISDKIINLLGIEKVKSLSDEELYSLGFNVTRFRQDYSDDYNEFRRR